MSSRASAHRVYLVSGMFGFGHLAGYDYFGHVARAIEARFVAEGVPMALEVLAPPPTASMRRRAAMVATAIAASADGSDGPIHIVGHSTGGLDARLVASPTTNLPVSADVLAWQKRLRSIVTINTPHYGTPLAAFFTTAAGTRLLYAISLLTVTTLSLGGLPLSAFSSLVAAIGSIDTAMGFDVRLLDRATSLVLRVIGERTRGEVHDWFGEIRADQGGIVQIMPEAMDMFNAALEDRSGTRYACIATASPPPRPLRTLMSMRSPYAALCATLYSTLYEVVSRPVERYAYASPTAEAAQLVTEQIGHELDDAMNDGVVPTESMLWGDLVWVGKGDHLDVVGHFRDDQRDDEKHVDWLTSGAHFDRARFRSMTDALTDVLLET